ncbi:hypothetical protein ABFS82_11G120100 [Erythranthe guttata]|nr:PREDICTED: foot protein 1 variant 1-like isoform X1 [Erythranthe guttata]|eukprot:XP_012840598.1 PREDICTED: foot protein 1 variant 1-like isoform X1 [Erythranthe guttata]
MPLTVKEAMKITLMQSEPEPEPEAEAEDSGGTPERCFHIIRKEYDTVPLKYKGCPPGWIPVASDRRPIPPGWTAAPPTEGIPVSHVEVPVPFYVMPEDTVLAEAKILKLGELIPPGWKFCPRFWNILLPGWTPCLRSAEIMPLTWQAVPRNWQLFPPTTTVKEEAETPPRPRCLAVPKEYSVMRPCFKAYPPDWVRVERGYRAIPPGWSAAPPPPADGTNPPPVSRVKVPRVPVIRHPPANVVLPTPKIIMSNESMPHGWRMLPLLWSVVTPGWKTCLKDIKLMPPTWQSVPLGWQIFPPPPPADPTTPPPPSGSASA